jgi:chemotaxis protein methyltransferase CheR
MWSGMKGVEARLTDAEFERARRLALELAGIELLDRHRDLLPRRRNRLGYAEAFDALLDAAERGEPESCRRFVELLTTNVTGFFRHPRHFDLAAEQALWAAHRRQVARVWSAAAATGEEPYSLAMALIDVFRRDDPPVTIVATDVDETALAIARNAEYGEAALAQVDPAARARFFGDPTASGRRRLVPAVRRLVDFRRLNLADLDWGVEGLLDVVFCRNVLMYLEAGYRYSVLERIASLLAPGGLLLLDPSEHLGGAAPLFVRRGHGVYARHARAARISLGSLGR